MVGFLQEVTWNSTLKDELEFPSLLFRCEGQGSHVEISLQNSSVANRACCEDDTLPGSHESAMVPQDMESWGLNITLGQESGEEGAGRSGEKAEHRQSCWAPKPGLGGALCSVLSTSRQVSTGADSVPLEQLCSPCSPRKRSQLPWTDLVLRTRLLQTLTRKHRPRPPLEKPATRVLTPESPCG